MKHSSRIVLVVLWTAGLGGCAAEGPRFVHETVRVPPKFQGARACVGDVSDHERYVEAFEDGWWDCVSRFAADIDYRSSVYDRSANGWPSAVEGYADGFGDAERQVLENIQGFGKARTREALLAIWNCP